MNAFRQEVTCVEYKEAGVTCHKNIPIFISFLGVEGPDKITALGLSIEDALELKVGLEAALRDFKEQGLTPHVS
jgi:hypothetical protein